MKAKKKHYNPKFPFVWYMTRLGIEKKIFQDGCFFFASKGYLKSDLWPNRKSETPRPIYTRDQHKISVRLIYNSTWNWKKNFQDRCFFFASKGYLKANLWPNRKSETPRPIYTRDQHKISVRLIYNSTRNWKIFCPVFSTFLGVLAFRMAQM